MAREEDSFALGQSGSALGLYRMLGAGSTIEKVSDLIAVARKIERATRLRSGPSRRSARTQNLQGMRARLPEGNGAGGIQMNREKLSRMQWKRLRVRPNLNVTSTDSCLHAAYGKPVSEC